MANLHIAGTLEIDDTGVVLSDLGKQVLLWSSSATSLGVFKSTLSQSIANFNYLLITFLGYKSDNTYNYALINTKDITSGKRTFYISGVSIVQKQTFAFSFRNATVETDNITIDWNTGLYQIDTNTYDGSADYCIPQAIYGIK